MRLCLSLSLSSVMVGVSQLKTQDISETSATLVWTPPPLHYDTYLITFNSQVGDGPGRIQTPVQ